MAGDDCPVPVIERPSARPIVDEPDPALAVELVAAFFTTIGEQYARGEGGDPGRGRSW
jgi:hypothetical protein